jgi:hypothetical protein
MTRPGGVIVEELREARLMGDALHELRHSLRAIESSIYALSTRNTQRRGALEAELLALADPWPGQATAPREQPQSVDSFSGPAGGRQT